MAAPNVLRVGTPENIFVECQDCTDDNDIRVEIIAITYPTKSKRLASTSVTLTRAKSFQDFGQIKVMEEYWNILYIILLVFIYFYILALLVF